MAQVAARSKANEITRAEPLLESLEIEGVVVTGDALLTKREIVRHLVEDKHADYVFVAKANQPTLRKDIADLFTAQEQDAKRRQQATKNKKPLETEAFPPLSTRPSIRAMGASRRGRSGRAPS